MPPQLYCPTGLVNPTPQGHRLCIFSSKLRFVSKWSVRVLALYHQSQVEWALWRLRTGVRTWRKPPPEFLDRV